MSELPAERPPPPPGPPLAQAAAAILVVLALVLLGEAWCLERLRPAVDGPGRGDRSLPLELALWVSGALVGERPLGLPVLVVATTVGCALLRRLPPAAAGTALVAVVAAGTLLAVVLPWVVLTPVRY